MSEVRLIVDHLRLNYSGPFDVKAFYNHITAFVNERGFDIKIDREFELKTKNGKQMEFQINPWKRITDTVRHWIMVRVIIKDYQRVDAIVDNKKVKIGTGKVTMDIDGFLELDESHRWEAFPAFQFIRAIYYNFFYKVYTERFEQRLNQDIHHLYHTIEQFFNLYRHYKIVSKPQIFE
jgi:hypothetical protein